MNLLFKMLDYFFSKYDEKEGLYLGKKVILNLTNGQTVKAVYSELPNGTGFGYYDPLTKKYILDNEITCVVY